MDYSLSLHHDEKQFVAALVRGNRDAQRALYEEYYAPLMSICQRYAGSEDEAMDLLHESFIKIFKKISRYESGTALLAWMGKESKRRASLAGHGRTLSLWTRLVRP